MKTRSVWSSQVDSLSTSRNGGGGITGLVGDRHPLRPERAQVQPDRGRARAAVEAEHERASGSRDVVQGVGDEEDPRLGFPLGVLDRHQPGRGRVLELFAVDLDLMVGDDRFFVCRSLGFRLLGGLLLAGRNLGRRGLGLGLGFLGLARRWLLSQDETSPKTPPRYSRSRSTPVACDIASWGTTGVSAAAVDDLEQKDRVALDELTRPRAAGPGGQSFG